MKRLLSIELQKIWMNKASRILTLTYFILHSFIALIASIKFDIGPFKFHLAEMGIFNFPFIWHFNTYIAAILKLFLAIVIVSMMANEYTYGTLKQNLIDEIWLTICPLILGGQNSPTPADGEGFLSSVAPRLQLLEVKPVGQEVFLHYQVS